MTRSSAGAAAAVFLLLCSCRSAPPVVDIEKTRNRYMIGAVHAAKRQDIFIRGTANRQNALADMKVAKRRCAKLGVNLHRGLQGLAMAVYGDIVPRLRPGYELVILGEW